MKNLYCAGEKTGPLVGHTEAICTGVLAAFNAIKSARGEKALVLPDSLSIGLAVSSVREAIQDPRGPGAKIHLLRLHPVRAHEGAGPLQHRTQGHTGAGGKGGSGKHPGRLNAKGNRQTDFERLFHARRLTAPLCGPALSPGRFYASRTENPVTMPSIYRQSRSRSPKFKPSSSFRFYFPPRQFLAAACLSPLVFGI